MRGRRSRAGPLLQQLSAILRSDDLRVALLRLLLLLRVSRLQHKTPIDEANTMFECARPIWPLLRRPPLPLCLCLLQPPPATS